MALTRFDRKLQIDFKRGFSASASLLLDCLRAIINPAVASERLRECHVGPQSATRTVEAKRQ